MNRIIVIVMLTAATVMAAAQPLQFRGVNRDGIYPDKNLAESWPEQGPPLLATLEGIGDGFGSPSINEKGIFIAGMIGKKGYLFHYNHSHELVWKVHYGDEFDLKYPGSRGTPTLDDGLLYYSGTYGNMLCLESETGKVLWKRDLFGEYGADTIKWGYTESPLIYENLVYLTPGAPGHNVVALDKKTGELVWKLDNQGTHNAYNSPTLIRHNDADNILLLTSNALLFLKPLTGKVALSHPLTARRGMHACSPLYLGEKLFYSSGYGEGSVMFRINDSERRFDTLYSTKDMDVKLSGLIPFDGTVFGTSDRKKQWVGLDLASGDTVFTSREIKPGSFLMADSKFYLFSETGEVALAKPSKDGFEIISSFVIPVQPARLAFAHPVIHKGILYIRYRDNLWLYIVRDIQ